MGARLGLVEDHYLVITGLRDCLSELPEIGEVAAAPTVDELLGAAPAPDLVLLDLRLADGSRPADNVDHLRSQGCAVIAYTSGESVALLREAAAANVLGIISKREPVDVIIEGVRAGLRGEVVASTDWAAAIDADLEATVHLTPREREVLGLYASGSRGTPSSTTSVTSAPSTRPSPDRPTPRSTSTAGQSRTVSCRGTRERGDDPWPGWSLDLLRRRHGD